jgi:hypothetical protein
MEFLINATVALGAFALVAPLYLLVVAETVFWKCLLAAIGSALFSGFVSSVAVHSMHDWEAVKDELVFGTLLKLGKKSEG